MCDTMEVSMETSCSPAVLRIAIQSGVYSSFPLIRGCIELVVKLRGLLSRSGIL
jgi:hypothetical protein